MSILTLLISGHTFVELALLIVLISIGIYHYRKGTCSNKKKDEKQNHIQYIDDNHPYNLI